MNNKIAIVITLSKSHVHYCKALIASINYFNPELQIIILKDGVFNTDFAKKNANVKVVDSKEVNELHGLDLYILLNKLNILFLPQMGFDFDTFVHLDADSVLTNKIEYKDFGTEDFFILQGNKINCNDEKSMKAISHYAFNPKDFQEYTFNEDKLFYFSASHIAINKRIIPKLIEYLKIHRFELNKEFINDKRIRFNDQGFLNLMINYLSHTKQIDVKLNNIGIYGKQKSNEFPKLTLHNIKNKIDTQVLFIHYTASSRKVTMGAHNFGDILDFFLKRFYNDQLNYFFSEFIRIINFYKNGYTKRVRNKIKHYAKTQNK
jgi:hypothetical protein